MMSNPFYFMLKALVAMANFKIYDVTDWETNNYNTHFAQYLKT